ncbi:lysophosphatidic acid receptor 6 [Xiphias gladius]|uniref:lysophosphatidic acid receptor 6 n=1 Tax=Xiphias gladius TaxID=8245 RepID=UPI001A99D597|nr:lysophosphatidic acid receptor 6 [Xiphias gladius]
MADTLQVSNSSQMTGVHENASFSCAKDNAYYTNTIGIVVDWVIFLVGLPEVCLACYALLHILKKDKAAPIFALNLLLSDLIQIGITIIFIISRFFDGTFQPFVRARCIARMFVRLGLTSSLGFMLLISAERYLMVACPFWYRTNNTSKFAFLISLCMWTLSLAYCILDYVFLVHTTFSVLLFSIICLLPALFVVLFFTATWKSLNKSTAMRHETKNKSKVLGILGLVLGTYIVLFVPFSFRNIYYSLKGDNAADTEDSVRDLSEVVTSALVYLSPLIDSLIYVFIRRDIRDTVEAFPCCKRPLMKLNKWRDSLTAKSQTTTALELS